MQKHPERFTMNQFVDLCPRTRLLTIMKFYPYGPRKSLRDFGVVKKMRQLRQLYSWRRQAIGVLDKATLRMDVQVCIFFEVRF